MQSNRAMDAGECTLQGLRFRNFTDFFWHQKHCSRCQSLSYAATQSLSQPRDFCKVAKSANLSPFWSTDSSSLDVLDFLGLTDASKPTCDTSYGDASHEYSAPYDEQKYSFVPRYSPVQRIGIKPYQESQPTSQTQLVKHSLQNLYQQDKLPVISTTGYKDYSPIILQAQSKPQSTYLLTAGTDAKAPGASSSKPSLKAREISNTKSIDKIETQDNSKSSIFRKPKSPQEQDNVIYLMSATPTLSSLSTASSESSTSELINMIIKNDENKVDDEKRKADEDKYTHYRDLIQGRRATPGCAAVKTNPRNTKQLAYLHTRVTSLAIKEHGEDPESKKPENSQLAIDVEKEAHRRDDHHLSAPTPSQSMSTEYDQQLFDEIKKPPTPNELLASLQEHINLTKQSLEKLRHLASESDNIGRIQDKHTSLVDIPLQPANQIGNARPHSSMRQTSGSGSCEVPASYKWSSFRESNANADRPPIQPIRWPDTDNAVNDLSAHFSNRYSDSGYLETMFEGRDDRPSRATLLESQFTSISNWCREEPTGVHAVSTPMRSNTMYSTRLRYEADQEVRDEAAYVQPTLDVPANGDYAYPVHESDMRYSSPVQLDILLRDGTLPTSCNMLYIDCVLEHLKYMTESNNGLVRGYRWDDIQSTVDQTYELHVMSNKEYEDLPASILRSLSTFLKEDLIPALCAANEAQNMPTSTTRTLRSVKPGSYGNNSSSNLRSYIDANTYGQSWDDCLSPPPPVVQARNDAEYCNGAKPLPYARSQPCLSLFNPATDAVAMPRGRSAMDFASSSYSSNTALVHAPAVNDQHRIAPAYELQGLHDTNFELQDVGTEVVDDLEHQHHREPDLTLLAIAYGYHIAHHGDLSMVSTRDQCSPEGMVSFFARHQKHLLSMTATERRTLWRCIIHWDMAGNEQSYRDDGHQFK
jgi:hypothetical protein